jgi:hypothetical protein
VVNCQGLRENQSDAVKVTTTWVYTYRIKIAIFLNTPFLIIKKSIGLINI